MSTILWFKNFAYLQLFGKGARKTEQTV